MLLVHGFSSRRVMWQLLPFTKTLLVILLLSISPSSTTASKFKIQTEKTSFKLPSDTDLVFGFSESGQISLNYSIEELDQKSADLRYSLCVVSNDFIRDISYQRRHRRMEKTTKDSLENMTCDREPGEEIECLVQPIASNGTSITHQLAGDVGLYELYIFTIANCASEEDDAYYENDGDESVDSFSFRFEAEVSLTNPGTRYEHLGFEEALFPVLAPVTMALLLPIIIILLFITIFAFCRRLRVPFAVLILLVTVTVKALLALTTFLFFSGIGGSGVRPSWYLYVRLVLTSIGDTVFVFTLVAFSSGFAVLPAQWAPDDRSPVMLAYIGITLQIVIFIIVEGLFPFKFFLAIAYTIIASVIGGIITVSSFRNYSFLERYALLVHRSHIYVKTTPIGRLRLFYMLNVPITATVYLAKIIFLIIFDYVIHRPDLLWGCMEIADATLLIWPTIFVFPARRSPLYVNMANVCNDRLQQADAWRATQFPSARSPSHASTESRILSVASGDPGGGAPSIAAATDAQSTAATHAYSNDAGTNLVSDRESESTRSVVASAAVVAPGSEAQPPWTAWSSGMPLPRPDATTWGTRLDRVYATAVERREAPMLPITIVLGSPVQDAEGDLGDKVRLNVGIPTCGPMAKPAVFNEKGISAPQAHGEQDEGENDDGTVEDSDDREDGNPSVDGIRQAQARRWFFSRRGRGPTTRVAITENVAPGARTRDPSGMMNSWRTTLRENSRDRDEAMGADAQKRNEEDNNHRDGDEEAVDRVETAFPEIRDLSILSTADTIDGVLAPANNE